MITHFANYLILLPEHFDINFNTVTVFVEQRAFEIVVTPEREGGFSISVPELPGCFIQGETLEEVKLMSVELIAFI